jgi:hypothetical protein
MSKGKQLNGQITGDQKILSREQILHILSEMARAGSVTAAIALERALRLDPGEEDDEDDPFAELDAFRPTRRPKLLMPRGSEAA